MDRLTVKRNFDWLPNHMPKVAELVKARRTTDGDAHVNECWRRGVLLGEPGWFFAREGPLGIGTPEATWLSWPELTPLTAVSSNPALLIMKDKEASDGSK